MSSANVADFLGAAVEASGLTREEISEKAHISRQTLYRVLKAEISEIKLSTMVGICNALKIDPLEILRIYFGRKK